jgi:hypothetical protein
VGQSTGSMQVEDKINLLAYIVPRFGQDNSDTVLPAFVSALKPTYEVIRSKCPELIESDVELLGTELLASEILSGASSRIDFAKWLGALSGDELLNLLAMRKAFPEDAQAELEAYRQARVDAEDQREEYKRTMQEQIQTARTERSLYLNPRTEKMELMQKQK